ncbi:protein phosphatase 2C domain-containing protein [Bradyrhizobium sp. B025]|uniref:protein phosphatase 2C domain-containing protein n=1 Tax=Bradyrhizobium sp. B025 TaxID=3344829 RepID=UPI0035D4B14C
MPDEPQTFRVLRAFTVSKREDTANEDRFFHSDDKRICAVSDGASVSFDSGPWAQILCRRFVESLTLDREWLEAATYEYQARYDRDSMSWSHQAAFDQGSFATLLGVACSSDGKGARVFSVGDSLLAFIDNGELLRTIPYVSPAEFEKSPILISSNRAENRLLDQEALSAAWVDLTIASHNVPFLMLMTDALGLWLLEQPDRLRVSTLLELTDNDSFCQLVEVERAAGRLKRDDTTLIVIGYGRELPADS